jgi:putative transposase
MPRTARIARIASGGMVYHVINRGVGTQALFFNDEDSLAIERVIVETLEKGSMRIVSYCLMHNHWHFVLCSENDGDLGMFM